MPPVHYNAQPYRWWTDLSDRGLLNIGELIFNTSRIESFRAGRIGHHYDRSGKPLRGELSYAGGDANYDPSNHINGSDEYGPISAYGSPRLTVSDKDIPQAEGYQTIGTYPYGGAALYSAGNLSNNAFGATIYPKFSNQSVMRIGILYRTSTTPGGSFTVATTPDYANGISNPQATKTISTFGGVVETRIAWIDYFPSITGGQPTIFVSNIIGPLFICGWFTLDSAVPVGISIVGQACAGGRSLRHVLDGMMLAGPDTIAQQISDFADSLDDPDAVLLINTEYGGQNPSNASNFPLPHPYGINNEPLIKRVVYKPDENKFINPGFDLTGWTVTFEAREWKRGNGGDYPSAVISSYNPATGVPVFDRALPTYSGNETFYNYQMTCRAAPPDYATDGYVLDYFVKDMRLFVNMVRSACQRIGRKCRFIMFSCTAGKVPDNEWLNVMSRTTRDALGAEFVDDTDVTILDEGPDLVTFDQIATATGETDDVHMGPESFRFVANEGWASVVAATDPLPDDAELPALIAKLKTMQRIAGLPQATGDYVERTDGRLKVVDDRTEQMSGTLGRVAAATADQLDGDNQPVTLGTLAIGIADAKTAAEGAQEAAEEAASGGAGDGDTDVDHNTGGTDRYRYAKNSSGIDNATILAYVKSEYDAGTRVVRAKAITASDGRWVSTMRINAGITYLLRFEKPGVYGPDFDEVTP